MPVDLITERGAAQPRQHWPTWMRSLWHNWYFYSKTWRASIASSFIQPILYLAAMGLGVGSLVDRSSGGVDGVTYLKFVAPGLLAATVLQLGVNECTYPVLGGLKWIKSYWAKVATPLSAGDVVAGHLGWVAIHMTMVSSIYLLVMVAFGVPTSALALLVIPAAVLSGMATAAPTAAFAARQDDDTPFAIVYRLGVLPMFLFSGVFYPINRLPGWAQVIAQISPLTHGASLCRAVTLDTGLGPGLLVDASYLLAWMVVGIWLTTVAFTRRLVV